MADNTVTLVLDGDVSVAEFAKAIANFNELVAALSHEVGDQPIDWLISDLSYSSALASARGLGSTGAVAAAIAAYADVGAALESGTPLRHSSQVVSAASKLVSISDYRIQRVRMETAERESVIPVRKDAALPVASDDASLKIVPKLAPAYGGVQGRIQTLTSRGGLRFTLYDLLNDKAVSCYFEEGKQDKILDMWGKLAVVEGMVSRDPLTGRPLSIRQVSEITPIPEPGGRFDYQDARGVSPSVSGLSAEEAIRRSRDAN